MNGTEEIRVETAHGVRAALVHAPRQAASGAPLVLLLHGAGGTARLALGNTRWPALADREGIFLVAPEGTRRDPVRPPIFRQNPQAWNDGSGRGHTARTGIDDVAFLETLLEAVLRRGDADPARVFVCGFSNGGSMAYRFAAERPARVAAIAPVAGHCWVEPAASAQPVPALMIFGGADPLNPPAGGEVTTPWETVEFHPPVLQSLARWGAFNGCGPAVVESSPAEGLREWRSDGCRPGGETRLLLVEDLGHHWPGADRLLPAWVAGPASRRIDGVATIWEFFRSHGRG